MKFETTAGLLTAALTTFTRVIDRYSSIPILSCVVFDGRTIRGGDLDLCLSIPVPATIAKGKAAIDHRSLLNLVRHIPRDDTVRIEGGAEGVTVTFSSGRYDLPVLSADDYPDIRTGDLAPASVNREAFKQALAFVAPFISTEETRYYLNGICLDKDVAVATDGRRLGCHPLGCDLSDCGRPIIPRKAVSILASLPAPDTISFAKDGHPTMQVEAGGARLVAKLIDGTFPDWRRITAGRDERISSTLSLDGPELAAAARRAMTAIHPSYPGGTLAWGDGRVVLAAGGADCGKAREYLARASAEGEGHVSFNFHYLAGVCRRLAKAETITASIVGESDAVVFRASADAFILLMPMLGEKSLAAETLKMLSAEQSLGRAA